LFYYRIWVTLGFVPAVEFSFWAMLRRPCACSAMRLGEGCSSTAIGNYMPGTLAVWINPADRGFARVPGM
jgi:hypothetical protein